MYRSYDMFAMCELCGEYREECLLSEHGRVFCYNHSQRYASKRPHAHCYLCCQFAPCERHHIFRRKVSDLQVFLCCNCHRALHHNAKMEEEVITLVFARSMVLATLGNRAEKLFNEGGIQYVNDTNAVSPCLLHAA